jgi:hypothetical protein
LEPPPFCFCADEDDERLLEALVFEPPLLEPPLLEAPLFEPPLFAVVPERGLLFEALLLFAPLLLFEAVERFAELVAREPFELCELFFCLLDEPVFACAITPPWVFRNLG